MRKKLGYVTGATGCVGRNLVDELLADGWEVVVLHRRSSDLTRLRGCQVGFKEVDLHDPARVQAAIPVGVDAVFHAAANTSHWSIEQEVQWKDNVLATRHLVHAALAARVGRFIFTSTGATRFYQETDQYGAARLQVPYVRTKRMAELEVRAGVERGLDAVILQPIIVVGAYDYNSYVQIFSTLKRSRLKVAFPGRITFCHARDVARAHLQAYRRGRIGERYVLGGTYAPWRVFFQQAAEALGVQAQVRTVPTWMLMPAARLSAGLAYVTRRRPLLTPHLVKLVRDEPEITTYDTRKSREELGYESQPMECMIKDCLGWLNKEGRI